MNYNVTDKDGWTLAEGRIQRNHEQRNREEAARIVERIERNQRIERLVRASNKGPRTGYAAHLLENANPEFKVVDFLHYRNRELHAPMATRRVSVLTSAAVGGVMIGLGVGFLSIIAVWIFR